MELANEVRGTVGCSGRVCMWGYRGGTAEGSDANARDQQWMGPRRWEGQCGAMKDKVAGIVTCRG